MIAACEPALYVCWVSGAELKPVLNYDFFASPIFSTHNFSPQQSQFHCHDLCFHGQLPCVGVQGFLLVSVAAVRMQKAVKSKRTFCQGTTVVTKCACRCKCLYVHVFMHWAQAASALTTGESTVTLN